MIEILGNNLATLFQKTSLIGINTYKDENLEVWEVEINTFVKICELTDKDFKELCDKAWWGYVKGSNIVNPVSDFIINDKPIKAWVKYSIDEIRETACVWCERCLKTDNEIMKCNICNDNKFDNLKQYFTLTWDISRERDLIALILELAKVNNIKVSDLLKRYQEQREVINESNNCN